MSTLRLEHKGMSEKDSNKNLKAYFIPLPLLNGKVLLTEKYYSWRLSHEHR